MRVVQALYLKRFVAHKITARCEWQTSNVSRFYSRDFTEMYDCHSSHLYFVVLLSVDETYTLHTSIVIHVRFPFTRKMHALSTFTGD